MEWTDEHECYQHRKLTDRRLNDGQLTAERCHDLVERRNIIETKHQLRARDIDPWYHTANARRGPPITL